MDDLQWLSPDKLPFYFLFFIPGFIALQISSLISPTADLDFSKRIPSAIGYSALNYALMQLILIPIRASRVPNAPELVQLAFTFLVPALYPFAIKSLRDSQLAGITGSHSRAWDFVFSKRLKRWVRLHMKDDTVVCGWFGSNSQSTSYPIDEQLYIEKLYDVESDTNAWKERVSSAGAIISMSEVKYIEFFS